MTGWTPLHQRIVASSVWSAAYHVRIAWITLLAVAGRDGVAHVTVGGLARMANIKPEEAVDALRVLSEPDADTLTQEHEGRRIERVATGWRLLNWEAYRVLAKRAVLQEQNREAQAKWRERKRSGQSQASEVVEEGGDSGQGVKTPGKAVSERSRENHPASLQVVRVQMEMEGMSEALYPGLAARFYNHYESTATEGPNGEKVWRKGGAIITDWKSVLRTWRTNEDNDRAEKGGAVLRRPRKPAGEKDKETVGLDVPIEPKVTTYGQGTKQGTSEQQSTTAEED